MSKKERKYSLPDKKPNVKQNQKTRLVKGKYLCIITGAGHGIGRAISGLAFQEKGILPDAWAGSKLCLIDIDEEALNDTAGKKMRQFLAHRKITVDLFTTDLSKILQIENLMSKIDEKYDKDFERVILINGASTIGKVDKLQQVSESPSFVQNFWDLNITSKIFMANKVCNIFNASAKATVYVSSFDANQARPTLGLACMAQSAIKTFETVFAEENPHIGVVHYITNRLDTRSTKQISEESSDKTLSQEIQNDIMEGKLTSPLEAAKKLIQVLKTTADGNGKVTYVDANGE